MADDDEIDILGDFSFNSCFAQNNQGIPSCSNREDTVHPQWLLDSTETNWYDKQSKRYKEGSPRKLYGNNSSDKHYNDIHTAWSPAEREILIKEMTKFGRNIRKISQTLKTKTEAEIQALIEAEYGVNLETPSFGLDKPEDHDNVPAVVQEEIVTDDITNINNVINMITTGAPTINVPKKPFRKKNTNSKSLLKPDVLVDKKAELIAINPAEILYEDDLIIGSTESIGSDLDVTDIVSKNIVKFQAKVKAEKKIGNHRRKKSKNYDKGTSKNKNKELLKSPPVRQRKDSSLSEDSVKSPKMQIVLGSGLALPVSEGEQVIKIEKKKDSEPESDIEIDVDSDNESSTPKTTPNIKESRVTEEAPIAVPLSKFEPMPKRPKKINLDGGGGYTIMHTDSGDLYAVGAEPRKERAPRKQPVQLMHCRVYNAEKPAPCEVVLAVSTLLLMDLHAHTSRGEVMGLLGGHTHTSAGLLGGHTHTSAGLMGGHTHTGAGLLGGHTHTGAGLLGGHTHTGAGLLGGHTHTGAGLLGGHTHTGAGLLGGHTHTGAGLLGGHTHTGARTVRLDAYRAAAAAAGSTHCDMDPVSQSRAAESLRAAGHQLVGWHHSHPQFPAAPSAQDLVSQRGLQRALEWHGPFLGFITSQHWPTGRTASQYRCIRVEGDDDADLPTGYQLSVKLSADLTPDSLPTFLQELREVMIDNHNENELSVDLVKDICPQARMTYLEKCISSASHHMRSAGYEETDPIIEQLIQGIRDIFR